MKKEDIGYEEAVSNYTELREDSREIFFIRFPFYMIFLYSSVCCRK